MGNKVSTINGVRSSRFYEPGNAVNEIWLGDFELISHLPFGASDLDQSGWKKGQKYPMIPWKQFIIPLSAAGEGQGLAQSQGPAAGNATGAGVQSVARRGLSMLMSAPSLSGMPVAENLKSVARNFKGRIVGQGRVVRVPDAQELDFICWFVMQCLAVLVLLIPIYLAFELLARMAREARADATAAPYNPLRESSNPNVADGGTEESVDIDVESAAWDDKDAPRNTYQHHRQSNVPSFSAAITNAGIGTLFYLLGILLIRAHEVSMHISPERITALSPIIVRKPGAVSPAANINSIGDAYPTPFLSHLSIYHGHIGRYVQAGWVRAYWLLMTALCVLAVFAVGCLWSNVILMTVNQSSERSGASQGDEDCVWVAYVDEEKETGAVIVRESDCLTDSSDAVRTLVS